MTKKVRIENADTSNHVVLVRVMERGPNQTLQDGTVVSQAPDREVSSHLLKNPADLIEATIWSGKYLVIEEAQ